MLTHVVTHRMAQTSRRPHLDFSVQDAPMDGVDVLEGLHEGFGPSIPSAAFGHGHGHKLGAHGHGHAHGGWFDLSHYWGDDRAEEEDAKRDFIVLV